jgi:hypothetical protein
MSFLHSKIDFFVNFVINPLNAELSPISHLLALVGARHIVHISRIRVNVLNLEYGAVLVRDLILLAT